MLGPFATASHLTPIHQMSLAVLSRAACASMSTTSTTTTRDRGDRYGPMEWAQSESGSSCIQHAMVLSIASKQMCNTTRTFMKSTDNPLHHAVTVTMKDTMLL